MYMQIKTQKDIDKLNEDYHYFHDSCIIEIKYVSGLEVDEECGMSFPEDYKGHSLVLKFQSQITEKILELYFQSVRRFYLSAFTENFTNEIYEAKLYFIGKEINGEIRNLIVWANDNDFDIENISVDLSKPQASFIIADKLSYRMIL